jgi:hypothetical protein
MSDLISSMNICLILLVFISFFKECTHYIKFCVQSSLHNLRGFIHELLKIFWFHYLFSIFLTQHFNFLLLYLIFLLYIIFIIMTTWWCLGILCHSSSIRWDNSKMMWDIKLCTPSLSIKIIIILNIRNCRLWVLFSILLIWILLTSI